MLKRIAVLCALALSVLAVTTSASAAPNRAEGGAQATSLSGVRCVVAGVTFLVRNDLLKAAALGQIDYDTIDSDSGGSEGLINTDLPAGSFLPLLTVIRLHYTNPELFDWCL